MKITSSEQRPILHNNKNFRNENPDIEKFFTMCDKEADSFPKEDNIIIDKKIVDNIDCPVCCSNLHKQLFVKNGFLHVECVTCSHIYVKNRLNDSLLINNYSDDGINKLDRKIGSNDKRKKYWMAVYEKYINIVINRGLNYTNLIDVGTGGGRFLEYCSKHTPLDLYANDFCSDSYDSIVALIGKDRYFYQKKIQDIPFENFKFDIISLWGVMEHVTEPRDIFKSCMNLLNNDGRIIVLVPNLYSRAYQILGVRVPTLNSSNHIGFYTIESMGYLCSEFGMEIESYHQELPIIDLMYPFIHYSDTLIDEIIENNEGYYSVYIIRKVNN